MKNTKKEGFTIIEVILVLAIAGLIFLMVFIALPALQRWQRDTQRGQDLSRALTAVQSYQNKNRAKLPAAFDNGFINSYLKTGSDTFADPDGTDYSFVEGSIDGSATWEANQHKIYVTRNATCNGEFPVASSGASKVALQMKMEGGGISCTNN